jgi:hypothetical protein
MQEFLKAKRQAKRAAAADDEDSDPDLWAPVEGQPSGQVGAQGGGSQSTSRDTDEPVTKAVAAALLRKPSSRSELGGGQPFAQAATHVQQLGTTGEQQQQQSRQLQYDEAGQVIVPRHHRVKATPSEEPVVYAPLEEVPEGDIPAGGHVAANCCNVGSIQVSSRSAQFDLLPAACYCKGCGPCHNADRDPSTACIAAHHSHPVLLFALCLQLFVLCIQAPCGCQCRLPQMWGSPRRA